MEHYSSIPNIFKVENVRTVLLSFVVFCCLFWYFKRLGPNNIPPGPRGWPFIGSLPTLIRSSIGKEHPHDLMTRLARQYGKVFCLGFGGDVRVVVLNDFKSIKEAFQKPELSDRVPSMVTKQVTNGIGVLTASGDVWKHQRRFSLSVFRSFGVGKTSFDEQIAIEAKHLSNEIYKLSGKPFDPRLFLMNATSNMICSIVLGKRFEYTDREFHHLLSMLDKRVKLIGGGGLQAQIPLLRLLRRNAKEGLIDCVRENVAYFSQVVSDHKKCLEESGECQDLTDLYLKEIKRSENEPDTLTYVNEEHLVEFLDHLFLAGTETSSNTLAWCLLHLITDTEAQRRIQDEITAVCGGERLPQYSDRCEMPFTEAVILEVQRLHTVVPLAVPHRAGKTTTLQGLTIPKGSIVLSNLWAVLHEPDVWDDPDVFKPTRFLDQEGKVHIKEEWIPFSTGRRVCLGERLAKMEIFIFLTHLLHRFSFTKPTISSTLSFDGRSGATYGPNPYQLCAVDKEKA